MPKLYKYLSSLTILLTFNCWAMQGENPNKADEQLSDAEIEQQLQDVNRKIETIRRQKVAFLKQQVLKEEQKINRDHLQHRIDEIDGSSNINSAQELSNTQTNNFFDHSFFKYWNCEKACLAFIGIVAVLKIWFHYYINTVNKING